MAGRDNVLYHARITTSATAGQVIPLQLLYGIENVRQGYGTAKLKSIRGMYAVAGTDTNTFGAGIPIEIKNSNWVDPAGLIAGNAAGETNLSKNNLSYMRGRDKQLIPNTAWVINATLPWAWTYNASTAPYLDIYVLIEIEYSGVEGIDTENTIGSPVMKQAINQSVTGNANALFNIGSFDNLLQGVSYVLSEVSITTGAVGTAMFMVMEGFSNQKGLTRIIPIRQSDMAIQIAGSVYLTKQTYNLGMISNVALSSQAVQLNLELISSAN